MLRPPLLTTPRRIAAIALGALALAHCTSIPGTRPGDASSSKQQEAHGNAQAHDEVLRRYGAVDNPELQAYVGEIGRRLAPRGAAAQQDWHFTVVDSADVNAFSLPDGHVYVTRGLLAYLQSEAQLAAVLGHEIGHVTARHGVDAERVAEADKGSRLLSGLDGQTETPLLGALGEAWRAGYGRERELEADRLGADTLARAGYPPRAMIQALAALTSQAQVAAADVRSKHARQTYHAVVDAGADGGRELQQAVAEAESHAATRVREGERDYLEKLAGVVYGAGPAQGVVSDNLLLHEKRGLALQFPAGWQVQNRSDRVIALSPEGDAAVELRAAPRGDRPLEALQQELTLDAGARYEGGRLGGYPAAFAAGASQGRPVVAAAVVLGGVPYLITGIARDQATYARERSALRGAINSFRAMTAAEKRTVRPRVFKILPASAGLTLAELARQSPLGAEAEVQLRLMNGLYPHGEPRAGQLLKIVQ